MVAGLLSLLLLVSSMFGLLHVQGVEGAVLASLLTAIFLAVYFSLLARKSGWHKGGVFFVIPLSLVLLSAAVFLLVVKS